MVAFLFLTRDFVFSYPLNSKNLHSANFSAIVPILKFSGQAVSLAQMHSQVG
jgi:hypothetical protein